MDAFRCHATPTKVGDLFHISVSVLPWPLGKIVQAFTDACPAVKNEKCRCSALAFRCRVAALCFHMRRPRATEMRDLDALRAKVLTEQLLLTTRQISECSK